MDDTSMNKHFKIYIRQPV